MSRRLAAFVLLSALVLAVTVPSEAASSASGPASAQQDERSAWLPRIKLWLQAVTAHTPGEADGPSLSISSWSEAALDLVIADLAGLQKLVRRERERATRGEMNRSYEYKTTTFTRADLAELLGPQWSTPENWNSIFERGALLHSDIAMLIVPYGTSNAGCRSGAAVLASDGLIVGSSCVCFHWSVGRALLDQVEPFPSRNAIVRLWYLATIGSLLEGHDYANAGPHVEYAQHVFPLDADVLFQHGYFHEAMTAALVQVATREVTFRLPTAHEQLTEAAELYRQTLVSDPDRAEARVRRGRALASLGRHREAADELRKALAGDRGAQLRYYGELFLGDADQALGNDASARDCYRRAAALYPDAQSPRLALSLLTRRTGDHATAIAELEKALIHPFADRARTDPWWAYYDWQERRASDLLAELRNSFLAASRQ